jgi:ABC-type multidrug transport system permease subunit
VAWLSTAALCLVISGGIILASYAPRVAPHSVTVTLLVAGLLLLAASVTMLLRIREFSWTTFRSVYKWAQLAYLITAGMIEFAFAHDHTRGSSLVIVTLMLVVFSVSVPINIAFTAARYANPDWEPKRQASTT